MITAGTTAAQLLEVLAGDVLTCYGYPLAADTSVRPEVRATAERSERRWQTEVAHRERA